MALFADGDDMCVMYHVTRMVKSQILNRQKHSIDRGLTGGQAKTLDMDTRTLARAKASCSM